MASKIYISKDISGLLNTLANEKHVYVVMDSNLQHLAEFFIYFRKTFR